VVVTLPSLYVVVIFCETQLLLLCEVVEPVDDVVELVVEPVDGVVKKDKIFQW